MRARLSILLLLFALAACEDFPRDIEGTADRIRKDGVLRVAYAGLDGRQTRLAQRFSAAVGSKAGATVVREPDAGIEAQFARLEDGKIDLVVTEVAEDSPWVTEVAVLEPLERRVVGARTLTVSPVARNGENAWIGLLERAARDMEGRR